MPTYKAQHNFEHIHSLGGNRLRELVRALEWNSTQFCGGANGVFTSGNYAEFSRENYMSCVVKIKTVVETRFWVETVGPYSNSSFLVQRDQLGTIQDM